MKQIFYFIVIFAFNQYLGDQYYYIPFLDNQGNLNPQTEIQAQYLSSWTLIQGNSSVPVWSPIQTLPFSFDLNGSPVS